MVIYYKFNATKILFKTNEASHGLIKYFTFLVILAISRNVMTCWNKSRSKPCNIEYCNLKQTPSTPFWRKDTTLLLNEMEDAVEIVADEGT